MSDIYKSEEQLLQELDEMRRKLNDLESCRLEFERVKRHYKELLEAAPDAMIFVNSNYEIVMVNAQTETLFGYSPGELPGKKLDTLIPERFRQRHKQNVGDYFSNPSIRSMGSDLKIFGLKRDGSEFRADISLSPLRTDDGILVTAAVRDNTERIAAQEQIERNFHIQRVISTVLKMSLEPLSLEMQLDRTLDLILSVPNISPQSRGSIYLVEEEPPQLVIRAQKGMTDKQLSICGRVPFGTCLCGKAASSCEVLFTECVDEQHEISFHEDLSHGHYCVPIVSGNKPLGLINVLVSEGHNRSASEEEFLTAVANTIASVIERRRAEEDRQRLQGQLAQSEKMAALGRISANVAHEFRNPLTAIGGLARRLLAALREETAKEYAGSIVSEVLNLEKTLKYVLEYSRVTVPHLGKHNIGVIVKDVLEIYAEACREHNIRVKTGIADVPDMLIDRELAVEAVGSLVSNAVDAMPAGGELIISATIKSSDSRRYIAVEVSDSGEGMPPDVQDKIFEPFYTTKISKKGIGLGLPIAKKIVEDHGGFISFNNRPGKGTIFALYFPLNYKLEE